ncbi:ATP-binding protein [Bradyrhizobium sp. Rc2d]|uniref:sensor histidine kinase n=1 Tax=Bradyrhizobium sp. Rc2d TaxID=1855321 RepID=UPI0015A0397A|nr:ATP-binding protein [Bradyrhizobium sp. Rc2d]
MSVVSLRETLKSALGAILSLPDAAPVPIGDGAFAMDLSAVTGATSPNVHNGRAEIPLRGADGEITGVLCKIISIDIPICGSADIDRDTTKILVHDIANLLAVIDGGLRLLDVKTDAQDRAVIVERLRRAIQRGASLSRKLLDSNRPYCSTARPVSHDDIVDIGDLVDQTLRADVVVDTHIDPDLRQFQADPEELHLALLNLCKNASDAMPEGGTISVCARNVCVQIGAPWVEISVSDDGTGMSPDVLERAFEPYFTTKESGTGTGLGLAQVKRLVERCNGAINVQSAENKGTTVRMLFPCA